MSRPLISVCIATYRHGDYIEGCIRSALEQRVDAELEILVGVDPSPDDTLAICERLASQYPGRIRCIAHSPRLGFGSLNYQVLVAQARGDYIAQLDGDDHWLPGKLAAQLNALERHPSSPACYTNAAVINLGGQRVGPFTNLHPEQVSMDYLLEGGNFLNQSSMLYRSQHRDTVLSLDAPFLDYELNLLLASRGNIAFVNKELAAYLADSPHSVRTQNSESVRERYWRSLRSAEHLHATPDALLRGKAEFLRQVFFRSLSQRDLASFRRWWAVVSASTPGEQPRLGYYALAAIARRVPIEAGNVLRSRGLLSGEPTLYLR